MKKILTIVFLLSLLGPLAWAKKVATSQANVTIKQPSFFPLSEALKPLILPPQVFQIKSQGEYRHLGIDDWQANLILKGTYGFSDNKELNLKTGILTGTTNQTNFAGILAGVNYKFLEEKDRLPQLAVVGRLGFVGQGENSLTYGNDIFLIGGLVSKKLINNFWALEGETQLGAGNKAAGIPLISFANIIKASETFDVKTELAFNNFGFTTPNIISFNPAVFYHPAKNIDVSGGVKIGILGNAVLGNNFNLEITSRF